MGQGVIFLQPLGHFQARDFRQLNVHQDQVRLVFASQGQGLQALTGLQGLVALSIEQVMKQLHVQLVILDDEDFLGHPVSDATPAALGIRRAIFRRLFRTNILKPELVLSITP